ncbi:extensin-1-like [Iris pallida]|uniref:Extensin-1-like n=1 Tax=Iris pallida TaxID=29817 RepID=A0AAX6E7J6_IRIPA|nr:extensin-1-like [Iris pallida]
MTRKPCRLLASPTEPYTAMACCAARTPPWLPPPYVAPGSTSSVVCVARSALSSKLLPARTHQRASVRPAALGRSRSPCQHGAAGTTPTTS